MLSVESLWSAGLLRSEVGACPESLDCREREYFLHASESERKWKKAGPSVREQGHYPPCDVWSSI